MIFESLHESAQHGELYGNICRWHLRKDGQLTIYELLCTDKGEGSKFLAKLKQVPGATSIFAWCPASLPSNTWYERKGFVLERTKETKTGARLNGWRLHLA